MIDRRMLLRGGLLSFVQVLVVSLAYFVLYGLLYRVFGPEDFGVWATVMGIANLVRVGEAGAGTAATKFVTELRQTGTRRDIILVGSLCLALAAIGSGVAGLALALGLEWLSTLLTHNAYSALTPTVLTAMVAGVIAGCAVTVCSGILDGLGRFEYRVVLNALAAAAMPVALPVAASQGQLEGVAKAYLAVQCSTLALGIAVCAWATSRLPCRRVAPNACPSFRALASFVVGVQTVTLVRLALDPTAKFLIAAVSGPVLVGYFELASRLALQTRMAVSSVAQMSVPATKPKQSERPDDLRSSYADFGTSIKIASAFIHLLTMCSLCTLSLLWLGSLAPDFVLTGLILMLGWMLNTGPIVGYYFAISTGNLLRNNLAALALATSLALGALTSWWFGPYCVMLSYAFGLFSAGRIIEAPLRTPNRRRVMPAFRLVSALTGVLLTQSLAAHVLAGTQLQWSAPNFAIHLASGVSVLLIILLFRPALAEDEWISKAAKDTFQRLRRPTPSSAPG